MRQATAELTNTPGHEPTDAEVAPKLRTTPRQIARWRRGESAYVSLDAPLGSEPGAERMGEVIADEQAEPADLALAKKTDVETLKTVFKKLPDRGATILRPRFGINGVDEQTLEAIGHKFAVTREWIRQLEYKALKSLRRMLANLDKVAA